MKRLLLLHFIFMAITGAAQVRTPAELYPGLFEAVQMNRIFSDSKTFPDALALKDPKLIISLYNKQHNAAGFNLKKFVAENFAAPAAPAAGFHSDIKGGIRKHIDTLWTVLQRQADTIQASSLLPLPHPYIVPGGRFREVYYWDSYFTMLGLEESERYAIMRDMVDNFAYLIDTYGHIPNGNRSYYLSRSQPPYFALMVDLLARHSGRKVLLKYQPELLKEYRYWMQGADQVKPGNAYRHVVKIVDGTVMNRYWDNRCSPREEAYREDVSEARRSAQPHTAFYRNVRAAAESGWDFSSRWFADGRTLRTIQTTKLIPVDLNCLLYFLEQSIAESYRLNSDEAQARHYSRLAAARKKAIDRYCWNEKKKCFGDYNWVRREPSAQLSVAMTAPLFFNLASRRQALAVKNRVEQYFLMPGGVACTLVKTGQQWDRPNGWAPLQYIAIAGLKRYGFNALSDTIANRWIRIGLRTFNRTGKMVEKYNIEDENMSAGGGEYQLQDGFGWSNGVMEKLLATRPHNIGD